VELLFAETTRERDGLALSSRTTYLSAEERAKAPALHRALRGAEAAIEHGVHDVASLELLMRKLLAETDGVDVDYLAVIDPETFEAPADFHRDVLLAGAVRIGKTRLIDNIRVPRRRD
jgi:pantoate--beta-alanine ligase